MKKLKVSSWNDGKQNPNGNGYGIRVGVKGREYFEKNITKINLSIENSDFFEVKITNGFWRNCTEFRDKRIGEWMIMNNLAPWKKGENHKFNLTVLPNNKFHLEKLS
ncbi:hypothetical protein SAMN04489722_1102 [Algibacter lectus]|uniref:hypothetical protein n=1 Tax=Algibacter lectus TaxID=221126 RepID=UPI0008E3EC27|nr:hypothetical protein [Algibacter lectus]SFD45575.1 hypothetical protein SAMN04489722_1102 [Algibacter lectus]